MKRAGPDLFATESLQGQPLAARMRPRNLDEYVGQDHILGPGRLLRRAIKADQLSSIILSGPPGTGKTTLAMVIANSTRSVFRSMNAVLSGVAELREAIAEARDMRQLHGRRTILFVDEVHRWNKSQQDALLPWVENGTFILIGATTENPWFEVNPALVSRSRIFQLRSLVDAELERILDQALSDTLRGYGAFRVDLMEDARRHLMRTCNGDARTLLNALELAVESSVDPFPPVPGTVISIDLAAAEDSIQSKAILYDPDGDYHFDTISAFIKSVRGSDPDAALYWLARMVKGGESPRFLFRRLLVLASEDVGLADPGALSRVEAAASAFERTGLPEGQYFLAQATLDLCLCPKSNSALGYFDALKAVDEELVEVPDHLKDASRDGAALGHGEHYKYPHAWREHWVAQQYLPGGLKGKVFYQPGPLGWEGAQIPGILERRNMQLDLPDMDDILRPAHALPEDKGLDHFMRRQENRQEGFMTGLRDSIIEAMDIGESDRVLLAGDDAGFLIPGVQSRIPGGLLMTMASTAGSERFRHLGEAMSQARSSTLPSPESFVVTTWEYPVFPEGCSPETGASFRLLELYPAGTAVLAGLCRGSLRTPWVFAEILLSAQAGFISLLGKDFLGSAIGMRCRDIENQWRSELQARDRPRDLLEASGWKLVDSREQEYSRQRKLDPGMIQAWLDPVPGSLAAALTADQGTGILEELARELEGDLMGQRISRPVRVRLLRGLPAS